MKHLEKLTRKQLGEILLDEGLVSKSQLSDAEREQKQTGEQLGAILVESGYISEWDLAKAVASQYQLPFVQLGLFPKQKDLDGLFQEAEMRKRRFVPLDRIGSTMTLAVAEMPDLLFLQEIQERHKVTPFLFVAPITEIALRLDGGPSRSPSVAAAVAPKPPVAAVAAPAPAAPRPAPAEARPAPVPRPQKAEPERRRPVILASEDDSVPEEVIEGLEIFDRILPDEEPAARPAAGEKSRTARAMEASEMSWENIFDSANASVLKEMDED